MESNSIFQEKASRKIDNPQEETCAHKGDVLIYHSGSRKFVEGEVTDDFCEHVVCLDCNEHVDCESFCSEMKRPWEEIPY